MMLWGMEIRGRGCALSRRRYHFKGGGRLLEMEASLAHLHLDDRLPAAAGISGWAVRTFQINGVSVKCISLPIIRGPCHQSKAPPGWACALPDHRGHGHSEESEAFAQNPPSPTPPFLPAQTPSPWRSRRAGQGQ